MAQHQHDNNNMNIITGVEDGRIMSSWSFAKTIDMLQLARRLCFNRSKVLVSYCSHRSVSTISYDVYSRELRRYTSFSLNGNYFPPDQREIKTGVFIWRPSGRSHYCPQIVWFAEPLEWPLKWWKNHTLRSKIFAEDLDGNIIHGMLFFLRRRLHSLS